MKIAGIIAAGAAALTIISSSVLAQQALKGTVTQVNRIDGTIAIQPTPSGTVGANVKAVADEYKAKDGISLDALHAGDRVVFTSSEINGVKTVTKIERQ